MDKRLTCINFSADILGNPKEPNIISNNDSQILFGEEFVVEKEHGAYVKGYNATDGYKGYVERVNLALDVPQGSHIVTVLSAHLYPEPHFKSRPEANVPFMARISCVQSDNDDFFQTHDGLWIYKKHVQKIDTLSSARELAEIGSFFLNTPYLFGGRTCLGIDCAALVQLSMMKQGHKCPPRDTKDQVNNIGKSVEKSDLKRNDIVYFKGHVGIMVDDKHILNATARHMKTIIEPLSVLEKDYKDGITYIARL